MSQKAHRGSWNEGDPNRPKWGPKTRPVAEYEYRHADGTYAFTICKGQNPDGTKCFRTRRKNLMPFGDRIEPEHKVDFFSGMGNETPVLYRLPELIAAANTPGTVILVPEGEKDVESAVDLGFTATCNPFGALKWRDEFSPYLTGSNVIVIADADDTGRKHAGEVVTSINGHAKRVSTIAMPDGFKDLTEWKESREKSGQSKAVIKAELNGLIANVSATTNPQADKLIQSSKEFVGGFVPPFYLIDGLLQQQFVYSVTGMTGHGKTTVMLLIAAHVACGLSLDKREVEKARVLFFAGENPDDIRMRWIKLCEEMNLDAAAMDVFFLPGTPPISNAEIRKRIDAEAAKHGPFGLLIVDTSAAYFQGDDENSNAQLGAHARMLRTFVNLPGGPTVVVTAHPPKNPNMDNLLPRGGGAFLNEMDGNLVCINNDGVVTVHWHGKFRGPDFAPIPFKLNPGTSEKLKDAKGRLIWTVTAAPISEVEKTGLENTGRRRQDELLVLLSGTPHLSLAGMAEQLNWRTSKGEPNRTLVNRTLANLIKDKLIDRKRGRIVLTKDGEKAVKDADLM